MDDTGAFHSTKLAAFTSLFSEMIADALLSLPVEPTAEQGGEYHSSIQAGEQKQPTEPTTESEESWELITTDVEQENVSGGANAFDATNNPYVHS